jgi:hypothetical protein
MRGIAKSRDQFREADEEQACAHYIDNTEWIQALARKGSLG